jgi:hypothetical protein
MASYPGSPVVFPARADATTIFAAHVNGVQDEIAAIEQALLGQIPHDVNFGKAVRLTSIIGPPTITADQHDYAPTGLATATQIRASSDASRQITGLLAQPLGRLLLVLNAGGFDLTLPHESASSAAANRFFNAGGGNITLAPSAGVWLYYDASSRWRPVTLGAASGWTSIPHAGTIFSASAGTWTVEAADLQLFRYILVGRLCHLALRIVGSTTSAGMGTSLSISLPAAIAPVGSIQTVCHLAMPATFEVGILGTQVGQLQIFRTNFTAAFPALTNTFDIRGTISFEI